MIVYELRDASRYDDEPFERYHTLDGARAAIPRATWVETATGYWAGEDPDRPGRAWVSEHWYEPFIVRVDYRSVSSARIFDEPCEPPPPPRCTYKERMTTNTGWFCGLVLDHPGPHELHHGMFTSSTYIWSSEQPAVDPYPMGKEPSFSVDAHYMTIPDP